MFVYMFMSTIPDEFPFWGHGVLVPLLTLLGVWAYCHENISNNLKEISARVESWILQKRGLTYKLLNADLL